MLEVGVSGLIAGLTYALAGAAVVVAFRASRVLNFAIGGIGGLAAYAAWGTIGHGTPWGVGFLVAVAVGALAGAACELFVSRPLSRTSTLVATFGTLGALLIFQGAIEWAWGSNSEYLRTPLTWLHLRLGPITLDATDILTLIVAGVGLGVVLLVVNGTPLGLRMRAISAGPVTSTTLGVNVQRTSLAAWALAGAAGAGTAVVVILSTNQMEPTTFSGFLFLALVAVVVGGMTSLNGVVLGGVVFGVVLNYLEFYLSTQLTYTFTFLLLTGFLLFRPQGLTGRRERNVSEPVLPPVRRPGSGVARLAAPVTSRLAVLRHEKAPRLAVPASSSPTSGRHMLRTGVVLAGVMLALWFVAPALVQLALPEVVAYYIAIMGLDVLMGYCGQLSLAQGSFMAVGAFAGAIAVAHLNIPLALTLPFGLVVGALVGIVVGLPAIRLSGIYLGQVTLIFAFVVPELLLKWPAITGGGTGLPLPPVGNLAGFPQYVTYLGIAAAVTVGVQLMVRGRMGRRWRSVRDNEVAARGLGQRITVTKLVAFAVGCGLAGLAGVMVGMTTGYVSPNTFSVWTSIYLQAALVVGGLSSISGNMAGAAFVIIVPLYLQGTSIPPTLLFGGAFFLVLLVAPGGLASVGVRAANLARQLWPGRSRTVAPTAPASPVPPTAEPSGGLLDVRRLSAGYSGSIVLRDVDLRVEPGEIVGLVGPNGAGKSTLLRVVGGLVAPISGVVAFDGEPTGRLRGDEIGRRGVAHVVEGRGIFPNLSVDENLRLGAMAAVNPHAATREWVDELFPLLRARRHQLGGTLSGGEQQMLAVARSLLSEPKLLMLDEPSLGLAPSVTHELFRTLRRIRESGVSVLVVEQNIEDVFAMANRVYLLAAGSLVASGTPEQLRHRPDLITTYFGLETAAGSAGEARQDPAAPSWRVAAP